MTQRSRPDQLAQNQHFAALAQSADNVGLTADGHDLLQVIDSLIADLETGLPPFACRDGCNHCCYHPPLVTSLEWQVIHAHLMRLPVASQAAVVAAADALRPFAGHLAEVRREALDSSEAKAIDSEEMACPLLIEGRCVAYAARPLICRGYGYTLRASEGKRLFYGSQLGLDRVLDTFPRDAAFPEFDPYSARLGVLNEAAHGEEAFLPQWLWTHMAGGGLVPEVTFRPDFAAIPIQAVGG